MTNFTIDSAVKNAAEALIELLETRPQYTKNVGGFILPNGEGYSHCDNDEKIADAVSRLRDALRDRTL